MNKALINVKILRILQISAFIKDSYISLHCLSLVMYLM